MGLKIRAIRPRPCATPGTARPGKRLRAAVIDHIFKHFAEDLSTDMLAAVAHYSPDHLQKLFKQAVGETPKQYSLKLRLETAFLQLIIQPQKPVGEIALEGGFSSPAVFSLAMKSHFGRSPEQLLPHSVSGTPSTPVQSAPTHS